jgi:hypothetical protein
MGNIRDIYRTSQSKMQAMDINKGHLTIKASECSSVQGSGGQASQDKLTSHICWGGGAAKQFHSRYPRNFKNKLRCWKYGA